LDFGRTGVVDDTAKFEAQVLEITAGSGMLLEFSLVGSRPGNGFAAVAAGLRVARCDGGKPARERSRPLQGERHGQTRCEPGAGPQRWRATVYAGGPHTGSTPRRHKARDRSVARESKRRESFLPPARSGFLLA